jgi:regulator of protease activity HflC (stomatin/prohibitin superfamily)
MTTDTLRLEAQAALDELLKEGRLPFKLDARRIASEDSSQYTIRFHDSRLRSITVTWEAGQSFKEVVRAAVLDRVSRLTGPLNKKKR